MHEVTVDVGKNRLYLRLEKLESKDEIVTIVDKIKAACEKLKSGFTCLTDLRTYDVWDDQYLNFVANAQQAMVDVGLGKVVRVRKKFDAMGHFQFDRSSVKIGYHAQNATTIEEAEQILDDFQPDSIS